MPLQTSRRKLLLLNSTGTGGFFIEKKPGFVDTEMTVAKVMPVDLAMHRRLNSQNPEQLLDQLLNMPIPRYHRSLPRPHIYDSLRPKAARSPPIPATPVKVLNSTSPSGTLKKKKRVVFADDKGLALTTVRLFQADPPVSDEEELTLPVKIKTESSVQSKKPRLQLGFPQPSADSPSYRESLAKSLVHLQSCNLIYGSLVGKVRVCNISPEKAVHVRITYDSWRSHQDIQCTPVQQKNESTETELFVFNIPVPSCPSEQDRVEFCVSFRPGSGNVILWDNNGGQNYQILVEDMDSKEVSFVEKKPLRPQNVEIAQSLPLRNGPVLYKSAKLGSLTSYKNMIPMDRQTLTRQENIIPKSNSNNAGK
ncbi:protein phosphatase 1 regulatory subunit 3C-B-like [Neoarius graeffei]|uniref:protein phosphatase 1 regulatory subunit 3C-B-like n=1 Tax=Neoarius graeffei TaxID=443677 RepID=UPI00298C72D5|nr:protein phosphatase 1 regulatory subunit 3C-B-like [Neoarius graeffei]XP_060764533.1 protein phosphatase 1 regulatory subunit 3C-B-like [Neoarius graeffei]